MNFKLVFNQLCLLLIVLSAFMAVCAGLTPLLASAPTVRAAMTGLLGSAGIGVAAGWVGWLLTRRAGAHVGRREALLLVASSWILGAALAAMPYYMWALTATAPGHVFRQFIDCYFEAMSGLTTTGATVLGGPYPIESLPPSLLLWRSLTHWLGGLGIIVIFVAVLPSLGAGGKRLFTVEAPGPTQEGLRPHIRETARMLLYIYLSLSGIAVITLCIIGMPLFDSVCHTMSMLSTGGLSPKDASIHAYGHLRFDVTVAFFMLLAGVNFAVFYRMIKQRSLAVLWRDTELRVYFVLKVAGILLAWWVVTGTTTVFVDGSTIKNTPSAQALGHSFFVVTAMQTGTGFTTVDYEQWGIKALGPIFLLVCVGGCAGSTAGGIKVIRIWIAIRVMIAELEKAFRPNVVRPLKVGSNALDPDTKLAAVAYVAMFLTATALGATLLELFEPDPRCDFVTATTASLCTLGNVGPGLGGVGAAQNYGWFSGPSKALMSLLMALGRLEFFALLVLFTPRFWRPD